jgi:hypothetical protein
MMYNHMVTRMREKRLAIRVTEYELMQLQQEAEKRGVSASDIVRGWISQLPPPRQQTSKSD